MSQKTKKVGKYELGKTLGSGSFSKVKIGIDDQGNQFAIKIIEKEQLIREHLEEQLKREIAIMKMLNHPYIVKLYDVMQTQNHIYLVLELVTGGELFDKIVQAKRFEEDVARRYFQQLVVGLYFCHKQGIAHRDLKPENILVDEKDNVKIMDFGLANFQSASTSMTSAPQNMMSTVCGTPNYVAPEVLKEKGYNGVVSDVWSCGVILYVMLAGYLPFDDPKLNALFAKIERGEFRMAKNFSDGAKDLIGKLLVVDPAQRLTLDQVLLHPWFAKNFDKSVLATYSGTTSGKINDTANQFGAEAKESVQTVVRAEGAVDSASGFGAFEIINSMTSGVMAGFATTNMISIKCSTRFISRLDITETKVHVCKLLDDLKANPKARERDIKGFFNAPKGLLTYSISITPTLCKDLTIVEVRRGRGDTFDFHDFYSQVCNGLSMIICSEPAQKATAQDA